MAKKKIEQEKRENQRKKIEEIKKELIGEVEIERTKKKVEHIFILIHDFLSPMLINGISLKPCLCCIYTV